MPFDGSSDGPDKSVGWKKPWDKAFVLALDAATGKERWKTSRGMSRISHMTPLVTKLGDRDLLISPAGDAVQGFEPASGERLWTVYSKGEGVTPSPVIGDGLLFSGSGFGAETIRAIKLDPAARGDLTQDAHRLGAEARRADAAVAALSRRAAVHASRRTASRCARTARPARWSGRNGWRAAYSASPVFAAGRIYFLAENGNTTMIEPGRSFKELGVNPLEGHCQASPAISNGRIFIRSDKHLFCIK